jgi:hypothetical protein
MSEVPISADEFDLPIVPSEWMITLSLHQDSWRCDLSSPRGWAMGDGWSPRSAVEAALVSLKSADELARGGVKS